MPDRVYVVEEDGRKDRLVRATYSAMAERHCAQGRYRARIATKDDLEKLITSGVRVEQADEQAAKPVLSEPERDLLSS